MRYTAIVDIIRASDKKRLEQFVLRLEREGDTRADEALRKRLVERMIAPNEYLRNRNFRPMPQLYALKFDSNPPPVQEFVNSGKRVFFRLESGELTIKPLDNEKVELRFRRPVVIHRAPDPDSNQSTGVQGIPVAGWIDAHGQFVVLHVVNMTSDDSEYPDEWVIEHLR